MKIFAISDLHLSTQCNKPMDIYKGWDNYIEKIFLSWERNVSDNDVVLIGGDISWAMELKQAIYDIDRIKQQKGIKIIIKGNHDYWWKSITNLRNILGEKFYALQNDCIRINNCIFCGTRGWMNFENMKNKEVDIKIYNREIERLRLSLNSVKKINNNNDHIIAITHFPPFNPKLEKTPFTNLYSEYNVEIVIYGHIHRQNIYPLECKIDKTKYYLTSTDQLDHKVKFICEIENK